MHGKMNELRERANQDGHTARHYVSVQERIMPVVESHFEEMRDLLKADPENAKGADFLAMRTSIGMNVFETCRLLCLDPADVLKDVHDDVIYSAATTWLNESGVTSGKWHEHLTTLVARVTCHRELMREAQASQANGPH